ncbi:hypothetical protein JWV37_09590 [Sulfurospirillum sp. T05]|uniref:Uncharacterized protein n=1 Tax=Sulfurospirillum tamanense TaxID=2813362 RepID=A0ABS2WTS0_9BACT|nr:hypothetical protein [Sulfurospirillum tamanensis]MBN2965032.1 hypothetical protein [Sulfurospirillum tamanensis]
MKIKTMPYKVALTKIRKKSTLHKKDIRVDKADIATVLKNARILFVFKIHNASIKKQKKMLQNIGKLPHAQGIIVKFKIHQNWPMDNILETMNCLHGLLDETMPICFCTYTTHAMKPNKATLSIFVGSSTRTKPDIKLSKIFPTLSQTCQEEKLNATR